jgi:hypothetical protein
MSVADRAFSWLVTGPVGRVCAFFGDIAAYAWGRLRARVRERGAG